MTSLEFVPSLGRRSSVAEQLIRNQQVVGSTPTAGSTSRSIAFWTITRHVVGALRCRARDVRFPDSDVRFLIQISGFEASSAVVAGREWVSPHACEGRPDEDLQERSRHRTGSGTIARSQGEGMALGLQSQGAVSDVLPW